MKYRSFISRVSILMVVLVSSLALVFAGTSPTYAAEIQPTAVAGEDGSVIFKGLDQLKPGEKLEYVTTTNSGDTVTIGIENATTARSTKRWKIYREWLAFYDGYYINVSNNKITSADSWWVNLVGGTYSDRTLTHTSTMAEQKYSYSIQGWYSGTAWLRADVTGSDNNVRVTDGI
ncbi:hypothetical protein BW13_01740 [Bifidobacterium sp. UTCIF-37]|uniref:DUF5626 family protein n=1 Tax=unclassified Bifidobacterium TaxID=2608897 RepID=UPI001127FF46|nr:MULTISPECIES: DUF5626 family protein [unclassified Bifidobacterium]TPF86999.1 hypothetical protein BW13_01740 [Bifidobacterium sp. UTCIF-37]TPF90601.1 hypothetical protein BW11_03365 [Bifidobacterium sp. UTCIF-38]